MIETPSANGQALDPEPISHADDSTAPKDSSESFSSQKTPYKSSDPSMMRHEDTLEVPAAAISLACSLTVSP